MSKLKLAWAKRVSGSRFWKSTQILYRVSSRFWKRDLFLLWNNLSKNPVFENQLKFCIGFGGGSGNGIFVSAINKLTQKSRFWKSAQILYRVWWRFWERGEQNVCLTWVTVRIGFAEGFKMTILPNINIFRKNLHFQRWVTDRRGFGEGFKMKI